jgi:hypothetical protein
MDCTARSQTNFGFIGDLSKDAVEMDLNGVDFAELKRQAIAGIV